MTLTKIIHLAGNTVYPIGHGLMLMTWKPTPVPDEQCFEAIKAGIDSLPTGAKMFINSGEFYGNNPRTANLELIARFFDKYPTYAGKVFLSVKGAARQNLSPDSSEEGIRTSVDTINKTLRGTKTLDLFEPARIEAGHEIEDVMKRLAKLQKEGKFDHIGLSEISAKTLQRASAVAQVAAAEVEISPWSYEQDVQDLIATAKELGVVVVAYAPLGRGFLTGAISKPSDLEEGDFRKGLDRFQEAAMKHNQAIVDTINQLAADKKVTPAQLSIAWVASRGNHVLPLPGSSKASRTLENLHSGEIPFSETELKEIDKALGSHKVEGSRYIAAAGDGFRLMA